MTDLRQTENYASFMQSIGWKVERINSVNYFIRPFPLLGSFMKVQRPEEIDLSTVERLQKKHRVFQTIIEPKTNKDAMQIASHGLKQSTPYLPSKTIHINLTKSEPQLLKAMHHKTRYNIRLSQKKGVIVKETDDIKKFTALWKNAKFNRKFMSTKDISGLYKAFGKDAYILTAYKNNELLGGVMTVYADKIAYYMYAVTTEKGKKLFAPTLITWEQIRLAKKKGCKVFDFEGIYDDRFPIKSWEGFSRFKKGFGGKEVVYPGAFSKWIFVKIWGDGRAQR